MNPMEQAMKGWMEENKGWVDSLAAKPPEDPKPTPHSQAADRLLQAASALIYEAMRMLPAQPGDYHPTLSRSVQAIHMARANLQKP